MAKKTEITGVLVASLDTYTRGSVDNWLSRHLKNALKKHFGDDVVAFIECKGNGWSDLYTLEMKVWGKVVGATSSCDAFNATGHGLNPCSEADDSDGWRSIVKRSLLVHDCSDYVERAEDEKAVYPLLTELEAAIRGCEDEINALRSKALEALAKLPIPKAAKVRDTQVFWNDPSSATKDKFPRSFEKLIEEG